MDGGIIEAAYDNVEEVKKVFELAGLPFPQRYKEVLNDMLERKDWKWYKLPTVASERIFEAQFHTDDDGNPIPIAYQAASDRLDCVEMALCGTVSLLP